MKPFSKGEINKINKLYDEAINTAQIEYAEHAPNKYNNEALTYLGISNVSFQKKERMLQDEVLRNNGGTVSSRYSRLNARKEACEKINRMFGLNMSVDYREDVDIDMTNMIQGGEKIE